MDVFQRVAASWRLDGLTVSAGASEEQLRLLEARLACPLPDDVRSYFTLANGVDGCAMDKHLLAFWPIQRILAEADEVVAEVCDLEPNDVPIADYLINSWFVVLRRRSDGGVGVFVQGADLELSSLTEFFISIRCMSPVYREAPEAIIVGA